MPEKRVFNIVWVAQDHGAGETVEFKVDRVVQYDGQLISIQAP
jgi:hypothetical protein